MTMYATPDAASAIENLAKRMHSLEMAFTAPSILAANATSQFETITIGSGPSWPNFQNAFAGGTSGGIVLGLAVDAPTGLTLSWGSFFTEIFVDVGWTVPPGDTAVEYEIEIAKKTLPSGVYELQQIFRTAASNIRIKPLDPNSTYGVRVFALNRLSRRSTSLPATGWTDIAVGGDATIPGAVSGISAGAGLRSLTIFWNDLDATLYPDVARGSGLYEVWVATNNTFTTGVQVKRVSGTIMAFTNLLPNTAYFYRLAAIDSSGNQGPYSATGTATTGQAGGSDLAAGIITSDHIITAGLDAAVIKFGTMSGDRITTNTLDAVSIKSSSITSANITLAGGALVAGTPPTTGMLINSQGLSLYASGVRTVFLDALTGNGAFTGSISGSAIVGSTITGGVITGGDITGGTITGATIRTTLTGRRIEIVSTAETYSGVTTNFLKFIPVRDSGADADKPGRIYVQKFNDTESALVITAPNLANTSGGGGLFLNSYNGGAGTATLQASGGAGLGPSLKLNLFSDGSTSTTVEGSALYAATTNGLLNNPVWPVGLCAGQGAAFKGTGASTPNAPLLIKAWSHVGNTDDGGFMQVTLPNGAFPHGIFSVVLTPGDTDPYAVVWTAGIASYNAAGSTFYVQGIIANTGGAVAVGGHRVNIIAIGW